MALFSFADIKFKNTKRTGFGTNGNLLESRYAYNIYRYPEDLGSADKGHYIVFHINQQKQTQFKGQTTGDNPTIIQDRIEGRSRSPVEGLGEIGKAVGEKIDSQGLQKVASDYRFNFVRTIERVTDTVALYMPDTLGFINNQGYSDVQLGTDPIAKGSDVVVTAVDTIRKGGFNLDTLKQLGLNLAPFLANQLARNSAFLQTSFTALFGVVQNPKLELLYSAPEFRTFRFDFVFYPRSSTEATQVQNIISRLTFHQAPEIKTEGNGFFLVPPSEFDIQFYYNGKINPNIPKISTCVLQSIDLDYAPNGFAAYEVDSKYGDGSVPSVGGTGMPVAIRMSLQFKETDILTKSFYGNYSTNREYTRASQAGEYGSS